MQSAHSEYQNSGISSVSALFIKIFTNLQVTNKLYGGNRNDLLCIHANSLDQDQTALKRIHNVCYRDAKIGSILVARLDHIQQIDLK